MTQKLVCECCGMRLRGSRAGRIGAPVGIDTVKVVKTGITPMINTSIAHKEAGIGQIGAGMSRAPLECFKKALEAIVSKVSLKTEAIVSKVSLKTVSHSSSTPQSAS